MNTEAIEQVLNTVASRVESLERTAWEETWEDHHDCSECKDYGCSVGVCD